MSTLLDPLVDLHVHSTFSDDAVSTIEENLAAAEQRGLRTLGMVDHVRRDTTWVATFADAVATLSKRAKPTVLCGVEAKVLDTEGRVDLPADLPSLDYVLLADHQLPRPGGPMTPDAATVAIAQGELSVATVVDDLVEATVQGLDCYDRVVVAHLFSILPQIGLTDGVVPDRLVRRLGEKARAVGAVIEINEKWTCPSSWVARILVDCGVNLA